MAVRPGVSEPEERLFGGHTGAMLLVLSVGLGVSRLGHRILAPLIPTIIESFAITPFMAGIAFSLTSVGFALLQFPGGRLSDQLTRKTVLVSSLAVLLTGFLVLSLTTSYPLLLLGAAVIGIGDGLYGPASRGLLSDLFRAKRGSAFGIQGTFSAIGGIVAAGLAAAALAIGIWQAAFVPGVVGTAVLAVLLYRWGREPVTLKLVPPELGTTITRLFRRRRFQWLLVAYSLYAITAQGVVGFLPALLQADHGFSPSLASAAFAGLFVAGIVTQPIAGRLSDVSSRLLIAGAGLVVGNVGLAALVLARSPAVAVVGVVVFAAGQRAFPPAMQAHLMDRFPDESMAGDLGAMRTVYVGIGSLGPLYVGFVASRLSYTAAFAGFVVAFLACGLVILAIAATE